MFTAPVAHACWRKCVILALKPHSTVVSRKGDPRYQPLVLPALRHLDYLVINELEAGEFSGLEIRLPNGEPHIAHIAAAARELLDAGVRQRW